MNFIHLLPIATQMHQYVQICHPHAHLTILLPYLHWGKFLGIIKLDSSNTSYADAVALDTARTLLDDHDCFCGCIRMWWSISKRGEYAIIVDCYLISCWCIINKKWHYILFSQMWLFNYLFAMFNCKQTQETSCEDHDRRGTHQRSQNEFFGREVEDFEDKAKKFIVIQALQGRICCCSTTAMSINHARGKWSQG